MKAIIDIPEEIYTDIKENYQGNDVLYSAVKYGAPVNFCKYRTKDYVFYNDKWLKERWEMEMKLLGVDFSKHDAELLDKIQAEISMNAYPIVHGVNNHELGMTLYGILQVIDKYKIESEDN